MHGAFLRVNDIKLENLVILENGQIKLIDFGISNIDNSFFTSLTNNIVYGSKILFIMSYINEIIEVIKRL